MRRLTLSLLALAVLFGLSLWNSQRLAHVTGELNDTLERAGTLASAGDVVGAVELTNEALDLWHAHDTYLHVTLPHADTDAVLLDFQQLLRLLESGDTGGTYLAANARLMAEIDLLREMEALSVKNIF